MLKEFKERLTKDISSSYCEFETTISEIIYTCKSTPHNPTHAHEQFFFFEILSDSSKDMGMTARLLCFRNAIRQVKPQSKHSLRRKIILVWAF